LGVTSIGSAVVGWVKAKPQTQHVKEFQATWSRP